MSKWPAWAVIAVLSLLTACSSGEEKKRPITLGASSTSGAAIPVAKALCSLLEPLECKVVPTDGTQPLLAKINEDQLDLAIVPGDALHRAWMGYAPFKKGQAKKVRLLFALHNEAVTLVVQDDADISLFQENGSQRVNIGPEGSENARLMGELFESCKGVLGGLTQSHLEVDALTHALRSHAVDGYFERMSHPDFALSRSIADLSLRLVPIGGECVDTLLHARPYLQSVNIPGKIYRGVEAEVPTIGVKSWLLASKRMPEALVYKVVRKIMDNLETLQKSQAVLHRLSPRKMVIVEMDMPYHPGAMRYYTARGWFVVP